MDDLERFLRERLNVPGATLTMVEGNPVVEVPEITQDASIFMLADRAEYDLMEVMLIGKTITFNVAGISAGVTMARFGVRQATLADALYLLADSLAQERVLSDNGQSTPGAVDAQLLSIRQTLERAL